jgi:hypothetical protein
VFVCVCVCVCLCVVAHFLFNRTFAFCILFVGSRKIIHRTLPPISLQPIYYVSLPSFILALFISFLKTRFFFLPLHTFLSFFTTPPRVSNPAEKHIHSKLTLTLCRSSSGQSTGVTTEVQVQSQAFHLEILDKTTVGLVSL